MVDKMGNRLKPGLKVQHGGKKMVSEITVVTPVFVRLRRPSGRMLTLKPHQVLRIAA